MSKLIKHCINVAVPCANGTPVVKNFEGIIVLDNQPMEFRVISDVAYWCPRIGPGLYFFMNIKTPIGNLRLKWDGYIKSDTVSIQKTCDDNEYTTYIYNSENDYINDNFAELKTELYNTHIFVPAEEVTKCGINIFACSGYMIEDGARIETYRCFIREYFIDSNCEIYGYEKEFPKWMYGDFKEVSDELGRIKETEKRKDIMRLKD